MNYNFLMEYMPQLQLRRFDKLVSFHIFFNQDISLDIALTHLKFVVLIDNTHMEEKRVPDFFY